MCRQWKNYTIKAMLLFLSLVVTDRSVGYVLKWMYFNQKGEDYFYTTKTLDEQTADLIVLGSSRARNHYNPEILEDSLGISCYNAGRSGCFLVYQSAQLDLILDRYTPKAIILEVTPYDMEAGEGDYDRLSGLLPYQNHPSFKKVIRKKSHWEPYKCWSKIYPYNSLVLKMVKNLKDRGEFNANGFQPLHSVWNDSINSYGEHEMPIDKHKTEEMIHIINKCQEKGIKLTMVTSPMFAHCQITRTLSLTDSLCQKHNIKYYSFLNNPAYEESKLYHTPDHLNETGAEIFSKHIAHILKTDNIK